MLISYIAGDHPQGAAIIKTITLEINDLDGGAATMPEATVCHAPFKLYTHPPALIIIKV